MKRLAFAYVLILSALPIQAQADDPPKPVVPVASIVVPPTQPLVVFTDGTVSKLPVTWKVQPKGTVFRVEGSLLVIPNPQPGTTYKLALVANGDAPSLDIDFADVTVPGGPVVGPPVIKPPAPTPTPAPGPVGNLRVLVLYETTSPNTLDQANAINSTAARTYLSAKCLKATDGRPEWRVWDKDTDATNESPEWQDALARAKADPAALPKAVVFAGNTVAAVAPVTTEADLLAFLKSKGGN